VLVVELNSASNGLSKGESRGLGLDVLELIPLILGDMLSNKRVLGSNEGEVSEVLLLEFLILFPEFVDSINHLLDKLDLRVSQSVLVGDVIGEASLATRLTTGATGLQVKLLAPGLQFLNSMLCPSGKVNMDRCSHTSTKICRAGVDVTVLFVKTEVFARFFLDRVLHSLNSLGKSFKDTSDISSHLHGDDTELILFIDPDKEGLLFIVEDTTTLRPISLHTGNSQVSVSRNKEEVIINQLLADIFLHASKRIVLTSKISREVLHSVLHQSFNTKTLFLGDSRRQTKSINGATNTDSAGVNWNILGNVALDL